MIRSFISRSLGLAFALVLPATGAPGNDSFANRIDLGNTYPAEIAGTSVDATEEPGEPGALAATVWYRWTAPASGQISLRITPSLYCVVYPDTGALPTLATGLPGIIDSVGHGSFDGVSVRYQVSAGQAYAIQVGGGHSGMTAAFSLRLRSVDFRINEIDVINDPPGPPNGTNESQFIEIIGPPNASLAGYKLAFFDHNVIHAGQAPGLGTGAYFSLPLDAFTTDAAGLLVLGYSSVTGRATSDWAVNGLKSGRHLAAVFYDPANVVSATSFLDLLPDSVSLSDAVMLGAQFGAAFNPYTDAPNLTDNNSLKSFERKPDGSGDFVLDFPSVAVFNDLVLALEVAPAGIVESAGAAAATGTVSRQGALASPAAVMLASGNPWRVGVPATVVIPAGQASATFPIDAVDNAIPEGVETVMITASYPGSTGGAAALQVTDDDILAFQPGLIAADFFIYPDGPLLGKSGGSGWSGGWVFDAMGTEGGTLDADGLLATVQGGSMEAFAATADRSVSSPPVASGKTVSLSRSLGLPLGAPGETAWFSFLIRPVTSQPGEYAGLRVSDAVDRQIFIGKPASGATGQFVLENVGGGGQVAGSTAPAVGGRNVRLVVKAEFSAGQSATFSLFFDPMPGVPEPLVPDVSKTIPFGPATRLGIFSNAATLFDDIRVGDAFASVATPFHASPLVINEVAVATAADANGDGVAVSSQDEFVEIVNQGSVPVDLSGASLHRSGVVNTVPDAGFPYGTILEPGAAIVVFGGGGVTEGHSAAFGTAWVQTTALNGVPGPGLGATGELWLRGEANTFISAVRFGTGNFNETRSLNRLPDLAAGAGNFVGHDTLPGGASFSPGRRSDASPFATQVAQLTLEPSSPTMLEGRGMNAGNLTITRPVADSSQLIVQLRSSDPDEASPNAWAIIPPNALSVSVPVITPEDPLEDGPQPVLLTAIASGFLNSSVSITVADNERMLFINEIDAAQWGGGGGGGGGSDFSEFIELYNGGFGSRPLDNFIVVLFNGSTGSYRVFDLAGKSTDGQGFFLINAANFPGLPFSNWFENKGAVAIYKKPAGGGFFAPDYNFPAGTAPVAGADLIDALVHGSADPPDAGLIGILTPGGTQANEGAVPNGINNLPNRTLGAWPDATAPFRPDLRVRTLSTPGMPNQLGESYALWALGYPGVGGPDDDDDGDGLENVLEYALGGNPFAFGGPLPAYTVNGMGLPRLSVAKGAMAGLDPFLHYTIEASDNLQTWSSDPINTIYSPTHLIGEFPFVVPRIFLRLSVEMEP